MASSMTSSKERLFNEMLQELAVRIGNEDLESMKFMMKPTEGDNGHIPMRILHQIRTPLDLFHEMIKQDIINPDNVEELKKMTRLCAGNNQLLMDTIKKFEDGGRVPYTGRRLLEDRSSGQVGQDLKNSHAFEIVIRSIGKNWRQLARSLGLCTVDIEAIEEKHPRQLREQSRACLEQWVDRNYGRVRQQDLVAALRKCDLNMMAHNVENCSTYPN